MEDRKMFTLITGASSGIGKEIAVRLSADRNIILHGRDIEKLKATKEACSSEGEILVWKHDLSETDNIEASLREFISSKGIYISEFIHSAGVANFLPLRSISENIMTNVMNVNFMSAVVISKLLMQKKLNERHLKNIIFISSNISNRAGKGCSIYAASKGALDSFMRCLAIELAPNVRVNSILPGGMLTEMTSGFLSDNELRERMEKVYPLGFGKPEYIAGVVKFLLSEDAAWITGEQITVDGGRSINITG